MKEKSTKSKLTSTIICALISGVFLANLSEEWRRGLWREFQTGMLGRRLEFMWRVDKSTFFMLLLCCIAAAVFVISLLRCLILLIRLISHGAEPVSPSPVRRKTAAQTKVSGARSRRRSAPVRTTTHVNGINRGDISSQAISCDHKNGRDKYLEQIQGFLKSGLIEKKEYDVLYARYKKLHISDDYH